MKSKIYEYITLRKNLVSRLMIRNTVVLVLIVMASLGSAQTLNICAGSSTVLTAINSLTLTSPSYSMNPGGATSPNGTFAVTPSVSTTYTLYVTGTNTASAIVTTTNTMNVQVAGGVLFSLSSPQNYTLGCGSLSVCPVMIVNAQTTPIPGGAVSFTFLAPGMSSVIPAGVLSVVSSNSITFAGTWTAVVRDNSSLCTGWSTFNVTSNTLAPNMSVTVPQQILTCNTSSMTMKIAPSSTVTHTWYFMGTPGVLQDDSIQVFTSPAASTASFINEYTLVATDVNNLCKTTTVIPVYQNIFPPIAAVAGPPLGGCQNTVVLTNVSSSGVPGSVFSNTLPVIGLLWEGPSPQPTAAISSTYLAQTTGVYTMTAKDMNNGCTKSTTYNFVAGLSAAFAHTITGGLAVFQNLSNVTSTTTTFYWDFGDGNTSTLQNPAHTYSNGGAYLVKHKIMDSGISCSDSTMQSVTISGVPCVANSNFSMVPTATAQVWDVIPSYPWNISAASWSWGDGSTSNTLYTSHQYSVAGMYNICLSVTVSCANTSSTCTSYSVYRGTQQAQVLEVHVVAPELISGLSLVGDKESASWNIVPNPNAGEFVLNFNTLKSEQMHVVVSDLTGRMVHEQWILSDSKQSLHTANLPSGMYLVTVEGSNQRTTKRMVVFH